jgi:hypothetical protein
MHIDGNGRISLAMYNTFLGEIILALSGSISNFDLAERWLSLFRNMARRGRLPNITCTGRLGLGAFFGTCSKC